MHNTPMNNILYPLLINLLQTPQTTLPITNYQLPTPDPDPDPSLDFFLFLPPTEVWLTTLGGILSSRGIRRRDAGSSSQSL